MNVKHTVIQAPPLYVTQLKNKHHEREIIKYNTRLEARTGQNLITLNELENDRTMIDRNDGIHLTPAAASKVVDMIMEHLTPQSKDKRVVTLNNNNVTITIPETTVKLLVCIHLRTILLFHYCCFSWVVYICCLMLLALCLVLLFARKYLPIILISDINHAQ